MSLKITNNSLLQKHFLKVDSSGLKFYDGAFLGAKSFRFNQIDSLLLSSNNTLSFQVGNQVFSIPTKAENPKHQNLINFLLHEVRRTTE
jgi:hypothetical protein